MSLPGFLFMCVLSVYICLIEGGQIHACPFYVQGERNGRNTSVSVSLSLALFASVGLRSHFQRATCFPIIRKIFYTRMLLLLLPCNVVHLFCLSYFVCSTCTLCLLRIQDTLGSKGTSASSFYFRAYVCLCMYFYG